MPQHVLPARIRRRPVKSRWSGSPLVRQWRLLDRLSSSQQGVTVRQAAKELGISLKTARRDIILLRQCGFDVAETIEEFGRKTWRIKQAVETTRSKRKQHQAIARLLDVVLAQAEWVGNARLVADLRTIRRRVRRKAE